MGQTNPMTGGMGQMGSMGSAGQFGQMSNPMGQMNAQGMGQMGQMGQMNSMGSMGQMGQMGSFGAGPSMSQAPGMQGAAASNDPFANMGATGIPSMSFNAGSLADSSPSAATKTPKKDTSALD